MKKHLIFKKVFIWIFFESSLPFWIFSTFSSVTFSYL